METKKVAAGLDPLSLSAVKISQTSSPERKESVGEDSPKTPAEFEPRANMPMAKETQATKMSGYDQSMKTADLINDGRQENQLLRIDGSTIESRVLDPRVAEPGMEKRASAKVKEGHFSERKFDEEEVKRKEVERREEISERLMPYEHVSHSDELVKVHIGGEIWDCFLLLTTYRLILAPYGKS